MDLAIVGATGGTGRHLVEQALARGHRVTAVARDPAQLVQQHANLRIVRGDVLDPGTLGPALAGAEAVLCALGSPGRAPTTVYSAGTRHILAALARDKPRRLVTVAAGAYVRDPADRPVVRLVVKPLLTRLLRGPYDDMRRMEAVVRASETDWTIVRPARLTDGPRTGRYRLAFEGAVPGGWTIARADVADCILAHRDDPAFRRAAVAVAY